MIEIREFNPRTVEANRGRRKPLVLPAGRHPAVLIGVIELGTHPVKWSAVGRQVRQVLLCWETGSRRPDGLPYVVSEPYLLSLHRGSRFMKMVVEWRGMADFAGRKLQLDEMLGWAALLVIEHARTASDWPYARLVGVEALTRDEGPATPPTLAPVRYRIGEGPPPRLPWRQTVYGTLLEEYIDRSEERRRARDRADRRSN